MQIKEYIKRVTVYAMGIVLIILMTLAFAYIWYNVYNIRIKLPFWRRGKHPCCHYLRHYFTAVFKNVWRPSCRIS